MAITDTFTDTAGTNVTSHTPDAGGTWTLATGTSGVITAAGRVRPGASSATSALHYHSAVPPSADYEVSADLYQVTITAGQLAGVLIRYDSAADSGYMARYLHGSAVIQLYRRVSGVFTLLTSSSYTITPTTATRIACQASGTTLYVKIDGSTVITYSDGSPITGAGRAGIAITGGTTPSDSAGLHIDNFDNGFTSSGVAGPVLFHSHYVNQGWR